MPVYEYECPNDGRFEIFSAVIGKPKEWICPKCRELAASVVSLCAMKPDEFWSGKYDPSTGQYFTSSSYRKRWMSDRNIAVVEKGMNLDGLSKEERIRKVQQKADKELEKTVADEVMKI